MRSTLEKMTIAWRWMKRWKTVPVWNWVRAARFYRSAQFDAAARFFESGLSKNPHHPAQFSARMDLAFCYLKKFEIQKSEDLLTAILEENPHYLPAYIRLAKLQIWSGRSREAVCTLQRVCRETQPSAEILALYLYAVVDHNGSLENIQDALSLISGLHLGIETSAMMRTAFAAVAVSRGAEHRALWLLEDMFDETDLPVEAVCVYADILLAQNKIGEALFNLKNGFKICPDHPKLLTLTAQAYLKAGEHFNAEFAQSLAIKACQNSGWLSIHALHTLAEAYYHANDKASSLMIAQRAKGVSIRNHGMYKNAHSLEQLIESLIVS